MQGVTITLLLLCLLGVTYQAQTFNPIHPGSIHVDQFSTLDNDRVNVPDFTVANFGAAVLDFKSLKSETPVEVDLAGGINVQGGDIKFFSTGDSGIGAQVNDFSVNALQGQVLLQSNNGDADFFSFASDFTIDSANSDINLRSPSGEISFDSSVFLLNGRQDAYGLSLTTENGGEVTIEAGVGSSTPLTSQVNIAAYDVSFDLQSTVSFTTQSGDVTLSGGDGVQISSDDIEINSQAGISTTSDASSILFESKGPFSIAANNLHILSSNNQAYSSVTGDISIGAIGTSTYQALDTVEFNSINNGIIVNAFEDIVATAGNNVLINSMGTLTVNSRDFELSSEKDRFAIDTNGDTTISALQSASIATVLDTSITAADQLAVQGTNAVNYDFQKDATLNSDDVFEINAVADANFFSNNLYFDVLDNYSFNGNAVMLTADNSLIKFESGLDVQITAKQDVKFNFVDAGSITGANLVSLASDGEASIESADLTVTATGDVNVEAADISYSVTGNVQQSSFRAFYIGGNVNVAGQDISVEANSIRARARDGIAMNADSEVTFDADNDLSHFSNFYVADGANFFISANSDVFVSADEKLIFQNDEKPDSLTTINAGDDITVSAGNALFSGDNLSLSASSQSHFFARDTFSLTSGDITFRADEVAIKSDGAFDFNAFDLTMNSSSTFFTASDAFGGDILFTTGSNYTHNSQYFNVKAARSVFTAVESIEFTVGENAEFHNTESGNINFSAGTDFEHSSNNTFFYAESFYGSGVSSVSMNSSGEFSIASSLKQDISFSSGGDLSIDAVDDIEFNTDILSFLGVENGVINANSYEATAGGFLSYLSAGYISITAATDIKNIVNGKEGTAEYVATDDIIVVGGDLSFSQKEGSIISNGGGARFYSVNDTQIFPASTLSMESYFLTSFTSFNGSIDLLSSGPIHVHGGASRYSSGMNAPLEMTANTSIEISSGFNGNVTFYSDFDYIVNAAQAFQIVGVAGRDSLITSTANDADICIKSDFIGDTQFIAGRSMDIHAYGDDAFLQVFADNSIEIISDEYAFNILSEGYQTDPQFTLHKTYGILLRTTHEDDNMSGIGVQSTVGSITIFGREGFQAGSRFGDFEQTAGGRVDIRTSFYDADILVQTTKGDIDVETNNGYFISGTPSIRADTQVNATGHQSWSANNFRIQQLSSIQDPSDAAIVIEGYYGDITMDSDNSFSFTGNDGGKIDVRSRNGDINFQTITYSIVADTGAIELEGRNSASFYADGNIAFSAQGTGGSTLIATPGGNDVIVNSDSTIDFTSTIGEIDFITTTGLNTQSGEDTIINGPCVNFYGGGSLEIDAVNEIFIRSTANAIGVDADVEVTVDAAEFSVYGTLINPLVRINAGGDGATDGLDITSDGDVLFTTQNDINLESSGANFLSSSNINFNSLNLNITSSGDSTTQTNIILQATNGDINIATPEYYEHSLTQTTITSQADITFTSVNHTEIAAVREVRFESSTTIIDVDYFTGNATYQGIRATDDDITFTVGADFYSLSDSIQDLDAFYNIDAQITDNLLFGSYNSAVNVDSAMGIVFEGAMQTFESTSLARTQLDGYNSISLTADGGDLIVTSENDVIFTAINNINYGAFLGKFSTVADTFQSTSGGALDIESESLTFSAYNFELNAAKEISIDVFSFALKTSNLGEINFLSGEDLTIEAQSQSYEAYHNLYLTSVAGLDNYGKNGVQIEFLNVDFLTSPVNGVVSFNSRGYTEFDIEDQLTLDGVVTYFISTGQSGVKLIGDGTLAQTSSADSDIISESGSIFIRGNPPNSALGDLDLNGENVYFQTHSDDGHIRAIATDDSTFTASVAFTIQPADDPGMRKGFGNITFTSEGSTSIVSQTVNLNSKDDLLATSSGLFSITAPIVDIGANRKVEINGASTTLTSDTDVSFTTSGDFADFLINTASLSFATKAGTTSFTDISQGETRILSGGNTVLQSPVIDLIAADNFLFRSDGSFISVEFTDITYTVTGNYYVNADTNRISHTYETYSVTTDLYHAFAEGSAYISNFNNLKTTNIRFESARNFEIITPSTIAASANVINIESGGSGDIKTLALNDITIDATTSIGFTAHGNLGSLGGAYVLQDDFNNPVKFTTGNYRGLFQNLINENTNAIEAIAVSGDVALEATTSITLTSNKGNINFRALRNVLYYAPDTGDQITFFGRSLTATPSFLATYRTIGLGIGFQNDYCSAGTDITCPTISFYVNKMINTLIWYGLVAPGNGFQSPTVSDPSS